MLWLLVRVIYHTVKVVKFNEYELSTEKYTLYVYVAALNIDLQGLYTSARQSFNGKKLGEGGRTVHSDSAQALEAEVHPERNLRQVAFTRVRQETQTGKRDFCEPQVNHDKAWAADSLF